MPYDDDDDYRVDMFYDITQFHQKFDLPVPTVPSFASEEIMEFRMKFLREELDEFVEAYKGENLVKAFDALIDLVYVALGTARMMNLPFDKGWAVVHQANMRKVRARHTSQSKRNTLFDVVKPVGWVSPEMMLQSILLKYEYEQRAKGIKKFPPNGETNEKGQVTEDVAVN